MTLNIADPGRYGWATLSRPLREPLRGVEDDVGCHLRNGSPLYSDCAFRRTACPYKEIEAWLRDACPVRMQIGILDIIPIGGLERVRYRTAAYPGGEDFRSELLGEVTGDRELFAWLDGDDIRWNPVSRTVPMAREQRGTLLCHSEGGVETIRLDGLNGLVGPICECCRDPQGLSRPLGSGVCLMGLSKFCTRIDRKSTRLNSSHVSISYAVLCL